MKNQAALGLTIFLLCSPMLAQKQKVFPKLLAVARYAYVETQFGPIDATVLDGRVTNEDREAVARVERAIQSWGHYQLTAKPSEAEVIFVARPGRLATVNSTGHVSTGNFPAGQQPRQRSTTTGITYGAEAGPPQDYLAVYVKDAEGKRSNPP